MIRLFQPRRDLTLSEQYAAIAALVERRVKNHPEHKPRVLWAEPDRSKFQVQRREVSA